MKKGTAALFALLLEFYSCSKKINNEPTKKEVDESYYNVAECMKIDDALRFRSELSLKYISNHSHNDELEYDLKEQQATPRTTTSILFHSNVNS